MSLSKFLLYKLTVHQFATILFKKKISLSGLKNTLFLKYVPLLACSVKSPEADG